MINEIELKKFVKVISQESTIIGIALVGSFKRNKNYNDIDFLVVSKDITKTIDFIKNRYIDFEIYINDDSIRIKNYFDKEIGLGIYDEKFLNNRITDFLNGCNIDPIYKNWNIVGWLPECLLFDIFNMEIMYEKNLYMSNLKQKIYNYPTKLKDSIILNCNTKIKNLSKRLNKSGKIEKKLIESEMLSLEIRKLFATKEMYFNGFKNIDNLLKELEEDDL